MIVSPKVSRLGALCRAWGGRLTIVSSETFAEIERDFMHASDRFVHPISLAPFTDGHAIDWHAKKIIASVASACVGAIIHEMGHVFASLVDPDHEDVNEWDWLGWEIAVARLVRCYRAWDAANGRYQLEGNGQTMTWGELSVAEKRRVAADRIDWSAALGLVDDNLRPLAIR